MLPTFGEKFGLAASRGTTVPPPESSSRLLTTADRSVDTHPHERMEDEAAAFPKSRCQLIQWDKERTASERLTLSILIIISYNIQMVVEM